MFFERKNKVGRPTNKEVKKRTMIRISIILILITVVACSGILIYSLLPKEEEVSGEEKNIANIYNSKADGLPKISSYGIYLSKKKNKVYLNIALSKKYYYRYTINGTTSSCETIKNKSYLTVAEGRKYYSYITIKLKSVSDFSSSIGKIYYYSDKKCKNSIKTESHEFVYDTVDPTVTEACLKDGRVYITAYDNARLGEVTTISANNSCIGTTNYTDISNKISLTNFSIPLKVTNPYRKKYVCLYDWAGNHTMKQITDCK